ncbi:MAG: hypothetical protein M3406_15195 [Chloroflexota bacterium]|nr:hypothetical protein [Chloroflexota bacterium]
MKRKYTVTGYEAITPFRLYRQDVQDIHTVVTSVSTLVRIETEDYTDIKTVEELASTSASANRSIEGFDIIGSKRGRARIRVSVNRRAGMVVLADDSADLVGAQEKIKRIMWRHAAVIALASTWPFFAILMGIAAAIVALQGELIVSAAMLVCALALGVLGWHLGRSRFTRIYLMDEQDVAGFLGRNRDILLMLIGTGLGLLIPIFVAVVRNMMQAWST